MDYLSVITLGHTPNVPLMCSASELGYRLEPHGYITLAVHRPGAVAADMGEGGVYPGWCGWVGTWEGGIPGTSPETQPRPD